MPEPQAVPERQSQGFVQAGGILLCFGCFEIASDGVNAYQRLLGAMYSCGRLMYLATASQRMANSVVGFVPDEPCIRWLNVCFEAADDASTSLV